MGGGVAGGILGVLIFLGFLNGQIGFGFGGGGGNGRGAENQVESTTVQEETSDRDERSLNEVLEQDGDTLNDTLPDIVEIRVTEDKVMVNGWPCENQEELRQFLTISQADNRKFEIVDDRALNETYQWVIEIFESMSLRYSESTSY